MVLIKKEGIILEATKHEFENQAVLNPGCIRVGDNVHMFYRAVKQGNYSSVGYCKLDGPLKVVERAKKPILFPEYDYEKHGVEDPRIIFFDGIYYLFFMAYDGTKVVTAYAVSKDLKNFEKKGKISHYISYSKAKKIFKQSNMPGKYFNFDIYNRTKNETADTVYLWGKDSFIFPKKFNGKFALLIRVLPNIQLIYFNDFKDLTIEYWRNHLSKLADHTVIDTKYWFESRAIGAGCPPIETDLGWLFIYHTIENSPKGRIYRAAAALLDKNNPCKEIARLDYPLFSPELEWELKGDVNNVVFPTGAAVFDETLYIYYGAADKRIAVASLDIKKLIDELLKNGNK